jgi:tetratricopeptide (TPR) repeat protein
MRLRTNRSALLVALCAALFVSHPPPAVAALPWAAGGAIAAREAILRLDLGEARATLAGAPDTDPDATGLRALLALYEGDCDAAAAIAARPTYPRDDFAAHTADVARGCARVTAATRTIVDDTRGIAVRLKNDDDEPLVPFLIDVADRGRAALERELGVALPRPLRIELVRDHYSLALMTGLPEEAAQTTGTVAVAKWGRVTMLSPRAAPHGYPWADTLMHELTHLAVTRASTDRAPLWLQEGVAKRQETRWREAFYFDDRPAADAVASTGFARGLALPLDKLGPSIAMLPSAEQAMTAFAEVTSFVRYWSRESGDNALPALLGELAHQPVDPALRAVSGADLHAWNDRWRAYLDRTASPHAEADSPKLAAAPRRELSRAARLGDLLAERAHDAEASPYLERAAALAPRDASLRVRLARVYRATGRNADADARIRALDGIDHPFGNYLALRGELLRREGDADAASTSLAHALWLDPLSLEVACEALSNTELPRDPARAALCDGLRRAREMR